MAFATAALTGITYFYADLALNWHIIAFVFCSTLCSYNIVKFYEFVVKNRHYKPTLKAIILLTAVALGFCFYLFLSFQLATQLTILAFGFLNFLYVIPLSKKSTNLRNSAGMKIYIVSVCWAGVTLLLPLLEAGFSISSDMILKFFQRFILTLVLILIFEIKDLENDAVELKTVPQNIGIEATKKWIYLLCILLFTLDFFKTGSYEYQMIVNALLIGVIALLTYFVNTNRSFYYTHLWAESVPIFWYLLILIADLF